MTTDLEKQFFDTFGIEPRQWYKISMGKKGNFYNEPSHKRYPKITDTHYLQLISLQSAYLSQKGIECCYMTCAKTLEELKKEILQDCIDYKKDIKQQVQALFKEE